MLEKNSIQDIVKVIKKRIFLILSIVVIVSGIVAGINYYLLPDIFQAQTQILVNQKSTSPEGDPWSRNESDLQLIDTYNVIIKSPAILNKVIEELKLDSTSEALSQQITVSNQVNSKVVNIIARDSNEKQAVDLANKTADVFKEEIPKLMNVDNINILSSAKFNENAKPIKPNKILNVAIAGVVSLLLGIGLVFLIEVFDTTIKTEKDIEEISSIPIIGVISPFESEERNRSKKKLQEQRRNVIV
ncbi:YveK family protein [Ureibacillus chungkukjangi]|uniref:Capsular polysaccharide biosynthesis protein n=1 Tax=Ureibacillus chungkukjangi TaxID=1202712 RepID=A0A318U2B1_9BACL|nr:Wzz/FepE/Etk N-terminal domain-containing protein [Ureibacillus chungkukjangi]PYF06069.1 capsular polysaccharide biosynthesis protein [Ureibacillus chungkukjangi]